MGVHGLWNLLEPTGKPVPLESLENKVLAVDVSIWLHQLVKGYQDARGSAIPNAHLLGLFHRICKLLFCKIKPVFVFDGEVPLLKKQTVAARQRQKGQLKDDADEMRQKVAKNILKHAALKEVLGSKSSASTSQLSQGKLREAPDLFELPPLPALKPSTEEEMEEMEWTDMDYMSSSDDDDDDDDDNDSSSPCKHVHADLHSVDVKSKDFLALPADIRHEILTDLKETRKQNSWGRLHEMPEESGQFSSFQVARLLKRRDFQVSLDQAEKEMGGRTMSLGELEDMLKDQGVATNTNLDLGKRIASDSTARFIYIKEAAKKTLFPSSSGTSRSGATTDSENIEESTSLTSSPLKETIPAASSTKSEVDSFIVEDEFEKDWSSDSDVDNPTLEKSAGVASRVDLARDFMFVASDLTNAEINNILNKRKTSPQKSPKGKLKGTVGKSSVSAFLVPESVAGPSSYIKPTLVAEDLDYIGIISDDSSDGDVDEIEPKVDVKKPVFEIIVQPEKEYNIEEDIFADVFSNVDQESVRKQTQIKGIVDLFKNTQKQASTSNTIIEKHEQIAEVTAVKSSFVPNLGSRIQEASGPEENSIILPAEELKPNLIADSVSLECEKSIKTTIEDKKVIENSIILPAEELKPNVVEDSTSPEFEKSVKTTIEDKVVPQTLSQGNESANGFDLQGDNLTATHSPSEVVNRQMSESENDSNQHTVDEIGPAVIGNLGIAMQESSNAQDDDSSSVEDDVTANQDSRSMNVPRLSTVDLQGMQAILEVQHSELVTEKNKTERMAASITAQMCGEAQELLKLFGLPYLVAPTEAEAQCAFLDQISLTEGTISDDSDIWLFGGRKVYKHFFNQKKHVMQFTCDNIQNMLNLARDQMILLALLTGSDYTCGLPGVGPVTALEILAAFPSAGTGNAANLMQGLRRFREWCGRGRPVEPGTAKLRTKLKDLQLSEGFPSPAVIDGYLRPTVDESKERFTWGKPDVDRLREYARVKFGWTKLKTDSILLPVVNKLSERQNQKSLDSYFKAKVKIPSFDTKLSKRVQKAVRRLGAETNNSDVEDDPQPVKKRRPLQASQQDKKKNTNKKGKKKDELSAVTVSQSIETSELSVPSFNTDREFILQREKDKLKLFQNKVEAIKLFRASRAKVEKTKVLKRPKRIEKPEAELSESSSD